VVWGDVCCTVEEAVQGVPQDMLGVMEDRHPRMECRGVSDGRSGCEGWKIVVRAWGIEGGV
jgi:hypothetical protein